MDIANTPALSAAHTWRVVTRDDIEFIIAGSAVQMHPAALRTARHLSGDPHSILKRARHYLFDELHPQKRPIGEPRLTWIECGDPDHENARTFEVFFIFDDEYTLYSVRFPGEHAPPNGFSKRAW